MECEGTRAGHQRERPGKSNNGAERNSAHAAAFFLFLTTSFWLCLIEPSAFHHMLEQYLPKYDTRSVVQSEKACAQGHFSEVDTIGDCVLNNFRLLNCGVTCISEDLWSTYKYICAVMFTS